MRSEDGHEQRPYKFLDSYKAADRDIFVARDREAEVLAADVISSRLVVLFAKTGTGKTSLINAGVRPRLEDVDYATFYVRVERDPVEAVRSVLREAGHPLRSAPGEPLSNDLREVSRVLDKPIVIFFDQFEEFFIHFSAPEYADKVKAFIGDTAQLYRDRESGIHVVFSMREEYFVEMDAFRKEIPSIFHNESSLRLRPFDREQALEAVIRPADLCHAELDEGLAERIVDELETGGAVEPARLSIVCDTLWQEGRMRSLRIADFERLGGAEEIVSRRLEQDVARLSDSHLVLFERLVPKLTTDYGTKYLRGFDELAESTGADPALLGSLVEELKVLHLVHDSVIHGTRYIEWASDFLAERTSALSRRAQILVSRRIFARAVSQMLASSDGGGSASDWVLPLKREEFERLSPYASELSLDADEARLALVTALAHGVAMRRWWDEAIKKSVDALALLRDVLAESRMTEAANNVLDLLVELGDATAVAFLEERLNEPTLAPGAVDALARMRNELAVQALARALDDDETAPLAIDALRRIGTSSAIGILAGALHGGAMVGLSAGTALDAIANEPQGLGRCQEAHAALVRVLDERAGFLFEEALRHGMPSRFWFDQARMRAVDVWATLRYFVTDPRVPLEQCEGSLRLLHELEDPTALELLELAAEQPRLNKPAERALEARDALERVRGESADVVSRAQSGQPADDRLNPADWDRLLSAIARTNCVAIVGPGVNYGVLPLGAELAQRLAYRYDLPDDYATDLAGAAEATELLVGRQALREELAELIRGGERPVFPEPDEPHAVLARLPLDLYVTANFDNLLEEGLYATGRSPLVEVMSREYHDLRASAMDPTPVQPLVLHLYGHASQPTSLVLTEDDFLEAAISFAAERNLIRPGIRARMQDAAILAIGFSPRSWPWRVIQHTLLELRAPSMRRKSLMVVLSPPGWREQERALLARQFSEANFAIYWGTASEFTRELAERWAAF
jgi:hypothetical protein